MVDLDRDIAAFWRATLHHGPDLAERIQRFTPSRDQIEELTCQAPRDVIEHGFRTLVLNRTRRGGVLAPGAALIEATARTARAWRRVGIPIRLGSVLPKSTTYAQTASLSARPMGCVLLEEVALYRSDACFLHRSALHGRR